MRTIGFVLVVLGFGSAVLNLTGTDFEFRLMSIFADYQPWAGLILGLIGVGLIYSTMRNQKTEPEPVVDPPYGRPDVNNPTVGDPQHHNQPAPGDARRPDSPQAYGNPALGDQTPGNQAPGTFPPPGPPRGE